jgi:hypothetical protein
MGVKTEERDYICALKEFPNTYEFLERQRIEAVERLDSLWRKENLLLRVKCKDAEYVFKMIHDKEKETEKDRIRMMIQEYPNLMPAVYLFERNSYIMDYIDGNSFFGLKEEERAAKINEAGRVLNENYSGRCFHAADIMHSVFNSFARYRKKRARFFDESELRLKVEDFDIFREVPHQLSHNDLNAANLLYGKKIKLIDPEDKGFNDISMDIGRYCASCFFNNYDYFGNDKNHSLEIAEAFLSNFDRSLLERAKYFIGESFLSFLDFDTVSVKKSVLKKLAINLLQKKGDIIGLLEDGLE